ncbi:hypothetical protein XI09_01715 [Bradyrhizobium sp. CCBAU 11386]|uniref:hypothetical protein n=1 Tax=Bradyrhizobium sp. CCBAU 11386 TaxID=1630837 RepID=UPI002302F245|nr:hypothetical protein [Bradyrhizobium sp. CCBAU 11386]MDA9503575.1 hypothetical protein [Bradyrhizobium sp. CCBAU 11386]
MNGSDEEDLAILKEKLAAVISRKQSKAFGAPVEETWEPTSWRDMITRYNDDLLITALLYVATFIISVVFAYEALSERDKVIPLLFSAALLGALLELIRRTLDTAFKRLTTIDLFVAEIVSILRVFSAANIIGDFAAQYLRVSDATASHSSTEPDSGVGFADSARKESYLTVFEKNSAELGALGSQVVNNVTAFSTFFKASRDATGAIANWTKAGYSQQQKKDDLIAIIDLCFLMTLHGHEALKYLISPNHENNFKHAENILASVQLQCFMFLDAVLPMDNFRRPRLKQRRERCEKLAQQYGYVFVAGK